MTAAPPTRLTGVSVAELLTLLDLTAVGTDDAGQHHFTGGHTVMSAETDHVFGGLVAAQAVIAAGRTVESARSVHSLHGNFLRAGDHRVPLTYSVEVTRDGRSFSHRQITVSQRGRTIAVLAASFGLPQPGPEHTTAAPRVPLPETLRSDVELMREAPDPHPAALVTNVVDLHTVPGDLAHQRQWFRSATPLPDDPLIHAAVLTYASDLRILQPALRPHGLSLTDEGHHLIQAATLSHTVWFHQPTRVDRWLLLDGHSPWAARGRTVARADIFDADGVLVAELAQEALIRYATAP